MHIFTVDVEDWFHILDNPKTETDAEWQLFPSRIENETTRILDLLDEFGQKGTFFILGWIARNHAHVVAEIARRGHEIACHSDMHQLVYQQSRNEFERDLLVSLDAIEGACGIRPNAYRAPGFSITDQAKWAFEILASNGIEIDCSIFPAQRGHGGIANFPQHGPCQVLMGNGKMLKCFPINIRNFLGRRIVYSGGGYFRLTPKILLRRWFLNDPYVMTYFHPRDFDPDQPLVPGLSPLRKVKSYVGLRTAEDKLRTLLSEIPFVTLSQAEAQMDWSSKPIVQV